MDDKEDAKAEPSERGEDTAQKDTEDERAQETKTQKQKQAGGWRKIRLIVGWYSYLESVIIRPIGTVLRVFSRDQAGVPLCLS